jgi:acetyltransferase-like isoleucine patch superfamily enzyme
LITELISNNPNVEIGTGTYASGSPLIRTHHPNNRIIIGKFCSLAHDVTIFAGGNHPMDFVTTHPLKLYLGIDEFSGWTSDCGDGEVTTRIGNDVWIGHGACVLSGAVIGDGAVIGAHAVVRGFVPPYAVVLGNPAQVVRYRFDPKAISGLLAVKWWDWPLDKIKVFAKDISSRNVQNFLAAHLEEQL